MRSDTLRVMHFVRYVKLGPKVESSFFPPFFFRKQYSTMESVLIEEVYGSRQTIDNVPLYKNLHTKLPRILQNRFQSIYGCKVLHKRQKSPAVSYIMSWNTSASFTLSFLPDESLLLLATDSFTGKPSFFVHKMFLQQCLESNMGLQSSFHNVSKELRSIYSGIKSDITPSLSPQHGFILVGNTDIVWRYE